MKRIHLFIISLVILVPISSQAGWQDFLGDIIGTDKPTTDQQPAPASPGVNFSQSQLNQAMKDALDQGVKKAVEQLGSKGGFLNDAQVRIPMPEQLQWAEKTLRTLHQDALADAFVESMNRAAEQAVPEATGIFLDSIKKMSVEDVQNIIQGPDDAATQYFRKTSEQQLSDKLQPLITRSTNQVGVTRYYKQMLDKASFLQPFVKTENMNLDDYITRKTLDGLFLKIAEEEKKIRDNPLERSTDIMKQVFDYYMK